MKKFLIFIVTIGFVNGILSPTIAQNRTKDAPAKYIDKSNMDFNVKPGDNFYLYANGNWIKNNPVPASKVRWGTFDMLRLTSSERLKAIAEEAAANPSTNSITQRVGDFYASAMDSVTIDKLGYDPIKPLLQKISSITGKEQVLDEIAALRRKGISGLLFGFSVGQDDKNVNTYIPRLAQGGTILADRDYYLKNDLRSKTIRSAYLSYMTDMFTLTGGNKDNASAKAASILALESDLAKLQMSRAEMRDPQKTYHKYAVTDFTNLTPGFNWQSMLPLMKVNNADSLLVNNPDFFIGASALFNTVPLETLKSYLQWHILHSAAPHLSAAFVKRAFEFTKIVTGQKEMSPRWITMTGLLDASLGELVGQLYVEKYFNEAAKQKMMALVNNVEKTFLRRSNTLPG